MLHTQVYPINKSQKKLINFFEIEMKLFNYKVPEYPSNTY